MRPTREHLVPDVPIEEDAGLVREDGLPQDPWLRVHARAGGRIVGTCKRAMVIPGTLDEWRSWTGLPFDESDPAAGNTRWAWDLMRTRPGPPETPRHTRLRGKLGTGEYGGRSLERREIEVTGGGRIFYLLYREKHTVRVEVAGTGHPQVTDK